MKPAFLSPAEQDQVRRAMSYWISHWDWECPILFGIELKDLQAVQQNWPRSVVEQEVEAAAVIGALRELLHGASAAPRDQLPEILGLEYAAATKLCEKVYALYRTAEA
jgi:hypothetical protein